MFGYVEIVPYTYVKKIYILCQDKEWPSKTKFMLAKLRAVPQIQICTHSSDVWLKGELRENIYLCL